MSSASIWWSWLLTAVGVTGFVFAGRKVWWAWYVNIGCQGLWMAYAIVTKQWGFIAAAVIYTVVFVRNAVEWTREHRKTDARLPGLREARSGCDPMRMCRGAAD